MKTTPAPPDPIEAGLRQARTGNAAPSDLHASIMHAVRASAAAGKPPRSPSRVPWLALVAALGVGVAAWWTFHPGSSTSHGVVSLPSDAPVALPTVSLTLVDPLSAEMNFVVEDFSRALQFLAACMP